ncbi:MAG: hypothetical protein WAS21_08525 [Geminicoccaceae bacterium]
MLIEFMGLPGAGKSTIARGVCASLRKSGCRLAWAPDAFVHSQPTLLRVYKLARIAAYGMFHPTSAAGAARRSQSFPQPSRSTAMRLMGNWLYVSAVCTMRPRSDELVVLDQGLGQGLYSLALQSDDDRLPAIRRALNGAPCPDIVVSVEAPSAVVRERMRCRAASYSATERLLLADQRWLDKSTRILGHVRQVLAERNVQVLRCDSHAQTAPAAIDFIASAIAQRLSAGGGR